MDEDMLSSLPPPPRLIRTHAIGHVDVGDSDVDDHARYATSANQMEDYRIARETALRNARNPDNIRADLESQNSNRGGRKSRRRRRRRGSRRHRSSRRHRRR